MRGNEEGVVTQMSPPPTHRRSLLHSMFSGRGGRTRFLGYIIVTSQKCIPKETSALPYIRKRVATLPCPKYMPFLSTTYYILLPLLLIIVGIPK